MIWFRRIGMPMRLSPAAIALPMATMTALGREPPGPCAIHVCRNPTPARTRPASSHIPAARNRPITCQACPQSDDPASICPGWCRAGTCPRCRAASAPRRPRTLCDTELSAPRGRWPTSQAPKEIWIRPAFLARDQTSRQGALRRLLACPKGRHRRTRRARLHELLKPSGHLIEWFV